MPVLWNPGMKGVSEIELAEGTRVVGDMHLDVEQPASVTGFCAWLGSLGDCPRLVILGDLFEYWIGMAQAESEGGIETLRALRECVAAGTAVDLLLGNRDFLMDARLARATGARIHPGGLLGRLDGGSKVLFLHGDELCIHDHSYQRLRRVLRSRPLTWLAPRLPTGLAQAVARRLRKASRSAVAAKTVPAKSQVPEAAQAAMVRHGAQNLVVGHAHRFRDEQPEGGGRWIVVDAFGGPRDQISVGPGGSLVAGASRAAYSPPAETLQKGGQRAP